jgi:membrane-bound lytic murein transglycosylase A
MVSPKYVILLGVLTGALGLFFLYHRLRPPVEVPAPILSQVSTAEYPFVAAIQDREGLRQALEAGVRYLRARDEGELLSWGGGAVTAGRLGRTLRAFSELLSRDLPQEQFQEEFTRRFLVYQVRGDKKSTTPREPVLVTGYFQPELSASIDACPGFPYPLYAPPRDLIEVSLQDFDPALPRSTIVGRVSGRRLVPYYTRDEIDQQLTIPGAPVLAWLRSPIEGLMLHIQGSGALRLSDGSLRYIHYAASNGRPYGSVGRWLIEQGFLSAGQADWPGIMAWAEEHPDVLGDALASNPRYIFFRWEERGPIGAFGDVLTPMQSVALDPAVYPPGALCFLKTTIPPEGSIDKGTEVFQGLVCNQDTGNAIKGPYRLDLYVGEGERAGMRAGRLRSPAALFLFLIKETGN